MIRYIRTQPAFGIYMSSIKQNRLTIYSDANWAAYQNARRSVIGFLVKRGDSLISWESIIKKQFEEAQQS